MPRRKTRTASTDAADQAELATDQADVTEATAAELATDQADVTEATAAELATDQADVTEATAALPVIEIERFDLTPDPGWAVQRPGQRRKKTKKAPARVVRQARAILRRGVEIALGAPYDMLKWTVRVYDETEMVDMMHRYERLEREAASLNRVKKPGEDTPQAVLVRAVARVLIDITVELAGPIDDLDRENKPITRDFAGVAFYAPDGTPNDEAIAALFDLLMGVPELRVRMDRGISKIREALRDDPARLLPLADGSHFTFDTSDTSDD